MASGNFLILRRPQSGRLEGRTAPIQRLAAVLALGASIVAGSTPVQAGGTLIVGMTAGDLPVTTGNPDQGFEGYRFVGYNLYNSLVLWDLSGGRQGGRHQAGPRHRVECRRGQRQALDLQIASGC